MLLQTGEVLIVQKENQADLCGSSPDGHSCLPNARMPLFLTVTSCAPTLTANLMSALPQRILRCGCDMCQYV